MANQRLTDKLVKMLPAPERGNVITYDADVKGFGCRVTAAGARSFIINYRRRSDGLERRYTIGSYPGWGVTAARERAKELKREIDSGGDPVGEHRADREAPTVNDLCDRFEEEYLPRKRPSTQHDYRGILRRHVRPALGKRKVASLAYEDIDALHRAVTRTGPYRANRMVAVLSKMCSLAIQWRWRADNPCRGIERNDEYSRRRYLSGDELVRLTAALAKHPDKQAADVVRFLLLTGCRRGEALAAQWADIDLTKGIWSRPPSSTKQKEHHEAPLSAPARQLLAAIRAAQVKRKSPGTYVFPGTGASGHRVELKKDWAQLCKAAQIKGLRLHDLRHSFASQLASSGASLPLIGSLLGHSSPVTTARYAHLFSDPQRAAVERVGAIIAGKPSAEVVPHRRRRR